MSTCISINGEFGSHETDDEFTCRLCGVFDEAGAVAKVQQLQRGGAELGRTLDYWLNLIVDATDSRDLLDEDGDGDWALIAERLAEMKRTMPTDAREANPHG